MILIQVININMLSFGEGGGELEVDVKGRLRREYGVPEGLCISRVEGRNGFGS